MTRSMLTLSAAALVVALGAPPAAAATSFYKPADHQNAWGFRVSMGFGGGFWGAPRVYARPVTVGAYADCQWRQVATPFGLRWQALCD